MRVPSEVSVVHGPVATSKDAASPPGSTQVPRILGNRRHSPLCWLAAFLTNSTLCLKTLNFMFGLMFEECCSGADKMYGFGLFSEIKMLAYFPFYSMYY